MKLRFCGETGLIFTIKINGKGINSIKINKYSAWTWLVRSKPK